MLILLLLFNDVAISCASDFPNVVPMPAVQVPEDDDSSVPDSCFDGCNDPNPSNAYRFVEAPAVRMMGDIEPAFLPFLNDLIDSVRISVTTPFSSSSIRFGKPCKASGNSSFFSSDSSSSSSFSSFDGAVIPTITKSASFNNVDIGKSVVTSATSSATCDMGDHSILPQGLSNVHDVKGLSFFPAAANWVVVVVERNPTLLLPRLDMGLP